MLYINTELLRSDTGEFFIFCVSTPYLSAVLHLFLVFGQRIPIELVQVRLGIVIDKTVEKFVRRCILMIEQAKSEHSEHLWISLCQGLLSFGVVDKNQLKQVFIETTDTDGFE